MDESLHKNPTALGVESVELQNISIKTRDNLIGLSKVWGELNTERQIEEIHTIRQMDTGTSNEVFMRCAASILYPKTNTIDARSAIKMLLDSYKRISGVQPPRTIDTKPMTEPVDTQPKPQPKKKKGKVKAKKTPRTTKKPNMTVRAVRSKVIAELDFSQDYMIDKKSEFAKDCQSAENVKLRIMPFEVEGYNKYLNAYGKSAEYILFYEVENPRKVYPLHFKSIKRFDKHESGETKRNGF